MTQNQVDELIALSNQYPNRDYQVQCSTPELTCVCPVTGQPDFGTVTMTYVPDQSIVELKSLKIYLGKFRDQGIHHEGITNKILDDLVSLLSPRSMTIETDWLVRGGIRTVVKASHNI